MGDQAVNEEKKQMRRAKGEVFVDAERCKGCAYCVKFCPTGVLALSEEFNSKGYHPPAVVNPDACTGCDLCGMYCPDFAIFGVRIKADEA
jgi:2-oxoglutarate ferredoxin oxidoreductase subunit delta